MFSKLTAFILLVFTSGALAETNSVETSAALKRLSLEELLDMEVTTVWKRPEKLTAAPSAIHTLFLAVGLAAPQAPGQAFKEQDVKAAFLYHFAQFVDWPPKAFPDADTPPIIGVLGADPFGATLDQIVQNEVVKYRRLEVQRYRRVEDITHCHILFISRSEERRLDQILDELNGRHILTVGDSESFALRGGMIRFLTEKNKIRLRINLDAAKAASVTISSKLLRAAEVIGPGESDK